MKYRSLTQANKLATIPESAAALGAVGALVGGSVSAVVNTYKVARKEEEITDAITNVAMETVGTGISSATAAAAMTAVGLGGLLGFAGFMAVATVTKGLWDSSFKSRQLKEARST
jgi:hypothetical protein